MRGPNYESDLRLVRSMLDTAGVGSGNFGQFTSGYPGVIEPSRFDFFAAVPTLLAALPLVTDPAVKEAVVRSLSHRGAKPIAARPLIEEFKRQEEFGLGLAWVIGNALASVSDSSVQDDLVELARDRRYGRSREMIVGRLGRFPQSNDLVRLLKELARDDDVALHAMSALHQMLGADEAEPVIAALLHDESPPVMKAAKIQIRKVRAAQKRRRTRDQRS